MSPVTKETSEDPDNEVRLIIDEADFVVDLFRCAFRCNAISSIANYKEFNQLKHVLDRRSLFIAQQKLWSESHEDLAQFLHALHERAKGNIPIQRTLSTNDDRLANYPRILDSFSKADELMEWLGLDQEKLIKKARKQSGKSQRESQRIIFHRVNDIISGLKYCKKDKETYHLTYNVSKHGKAILSVRPDLLYNLSAASEREGPHYLYQKKDGNNCVLRSKSSSFGNRHFESLVRHVVQMSETIRDLIYFFIGQEYPDRLHRLTESFDEQKDLRGDVDALFTKLKKNC